MIPHAETTVQYPRDALRVLVVDDNDRDRWLVTQALGRLKQPQLDIVEADSIDRALDMLDDQPFDVCVTDFNLGDADQTGMALLHAARHHNHLIPFVAISGFLDEDRIAERLLSAGFDDVVHKSDVLSANLSRVVRNAWLRGVHHQRLMIGATHDPLTNLLNRRGVRSLLHWELSRAQRSKQPVSLMQIDLDGFKEINDCWGHPAGDTALIHFAQLLREEVREIDAVGRVGGDEFTILLPETPREVAETIAERIRKRLRRSPVALPSGPLALEASIGISTTTPGPDIDAVMAASLASADDEMYRHKRGRKAGPDADEEAHADVGNTAG